MKEEFQWRKYGVGTTPPEPFKNGCFWKVFVISKLIIKIYYWLHAAVMTRYHLSALCWMYALVIIIKIFF